MNEYLSERIMQSAYILNDSKFVSLSLKNTIAVDANGYNQTASLLDCTGFSVTFEILKVKYKNGMMDNLFGRPYTSAAYRYRRLVKRHKEKERRKKLKERD